MSICSNGGLTTSVPFSVGRSWILPIDSKLFKMQQITFTFLSLSALQFSFLNGSVLFSRGSGKFRLFLFMFFLQFLNFIREGIMTVFALLI